MSAQDDIAATQPLFIVGVGASAGGLDALSKLMTALPDDNRLAVVVAQHVSPDHKSKMVELLTRHASWPVVTAENKVQIQPQHVYITPPDCEITIAEGKIILKKQHRTVHAVPSIDHFLTSLARDQQRYAVGIILSGTGKDGTEGIATIQLNEGYVFAQQPEEAQHKGMPDAAIQSGQVNEVVSVDQIGNRLVYYIENHGQLKSKDSNETSLQGIFRLLTNKTGTDFSKYKPSTIGRRIKKRLEALSLHTIDDYLQYIQENSDELDTLFETVLIGVTTFFRDRPTYEKLREYVKKILAQKQPGDAIRVWSVGCATGEEPYSIAILIAEELGKDRDKYTVQIFATDIDENALAVGRRGFYSNDLMENLGKQQLKEYFNHGNNGYEIKKTIRRWVLFSKHDISRDPPFVRLDLITCRNVLIYFDNELQHKVIPVFHYALNPESYLLLGKSENVTQLSDLFAKEDSKHKLFKKKDDVNLNTLKFTSFRQLKPARVLQKRQARAELSIEEAANETLVQTYEHPFVVVNEMMEVVHIRGKLQPYTDLSEGSLNANILKIVSKELHMELRTTFARAKRESAPHRSNIIRFQSYEQERLVRLSVTPFPFQRNDTDYYLVVFEQVDALEQYPFSAEELDLNKDENKNAVRVMELEHELAATKEHLQTFTEELETSNEELQSMNEELQSANEELKSSNEELETSNEELQSANEELQTANSELAISNENLIEKEAELIRTRDTLEVNRDRFRLALDNSPIILFYQDTDLRYTWLYNSFPDLVVDKAIGKTDYELPGKEYKELIALKEKVLATAESVRRAVEVNGLSYDLTIKPVRQKDQVVGIKGMAIDITERVKAQKSTEKNQAVVSSIIDESEDSIVAVDKHYRVIVSNPAQKGVFRQLFDKEIDTGVNILEILKEYPDDRATTQEMFTKAFQGESTKVERYKSSRLDDSDRNRFFDVSIVPIREKEGTIYGGALISRDITLKVVAEQQIKAIIERSANLIGEDFFKDLTDQIFDAFSVKYNYIGLLDPENRKVHTKALRIHGRLATNFSYSLQGAPCQAVANNEEARHIEHVQVHFPNDPKLQQWNAESYLGIPVSSPITGETLAILVMIDDKPFHESSNADYILKILTLRAGAELERMQANQKIREKEEQINNITNNVADVIYEFVTPTKGKPYFRFVSHAITDIYELTPQEALSDADLVLQVIHPDDTERFVQIRDEVVRGLHSKVSFEGRIVTPKSGVTKWVIITAKVEKQPNGDIMWYGTITDITTLKQTQEELNAAKEQAEQAARAKEDFLATMSHEIRTPLNAIVGLSGLLLDQDPKPQQVENLQALRFSSENLMNLINDILDFSKIEAGKVGAERVSFSLSFLLDSLQRAHQPAAQGNRNKLTVHHEVGVPDQVIGDPMKLGQILNNLLSNALKFTEDGQVTLTVSPERTEGEKTIARFSVEDTGIGISSDKLETIFEKFTQADSSTRRHYGGTGLGLTITRLLLELMGSSIQVESEVGKGTRFYFMLGLTPAPEEQDTDSGKADSAVVDEAVQGIRLLIVEDVAVNRMILRQYFQGWGEIEVDEATNGEEAVEKVANNDYDLILMDIRMPVMDGHEATAAIRAMPGKKKNIPIIALTADTADQLEEKRTKHFTDALIKPFDPEILKGKIIQHVSATTVDDLPLRSNTTAERKATSTTELNIRFAQAESPFNHPDKLKEFYRVTIRAFSEYQETYATAMVQRNADQLDDLIHKMRTSLAMFGLDSVYQHLQHDIELLSRGDSDAIQSAAQRTQAQLYEFVRQVRLRQQVLESTDQ